MHQLTIMSTRRPACCSTPQCRPLTSSPCHTVTQRELLAPVHSSPRCGGPGDEAEAGEERGRDRPAGQQHTHSLRRNGNIHHPRATNPDPSCLLTPPNTPLYPEGGGGDGGLGLGPGPIIGPSSQTNGCIGRTVADCKKANGLITNGLEGRRSSHSWSTSAPHCHVWP